MWLRLARYGAVTTAAAASFAGGIAYEKYGFLRNVDAATAIVPMPMPNVRPSSEAPIKVQQESRASEIMRHGYPGFDNLRTFEDFVLSYDRRTRVAHWVVEHLTPGRMVYDPSVDRSLCAFSDDKSLHRYYRSTNEDFKGSGFDRGHLAAAGNHRRTQNAISQTFLLSNMAPQVGKGFNRDKWNELEKHIRSLARKSENVYVCTGPLYLPSRESDGHMYVKYRVIGKNNVAVPTHFFKVALIEYAAGKFDMEAYVMPNAAIPDSVALSVFQVPPEGIEISAGFLIFDKFPKEKLRYINGKLANCPISLK